jgi:hypothetical protein
MANADRVGQRRPALTRHDASSTTGHAPAQIELAPKTITTPKPSRLIATAASTGSTVPIHDRTRLGVRSAGVRAAEDTVMGGRAPFSGRRRSRPERSPPGRIGGHDRHNSQTCRSSRTPARAARRRRARLAGAPARPPPRARGRARRGRRFSPKRHDVSSSGIIDGHMGSYMVKSGSNHAILCEGDGRAAEPSAIGGARPTRAESPQQGHQWSRGITYGHSLRASTVKPRRRARGRQGESRAGAGARQAGARLFRVCSRSAAFPTLVTFPTGILVQQGAPFSQRSM